MGPLSRDTRAFQEARVLSMLLATLSAAGSQAEGARLLATGIPSLFACGLSGVVLEEEGGWQLFVQRSGVLLSSTEASEVWARLEERVIAGSSQNEVRLPLDEETIAAVPIRTVHHRLGVILIGHPRGEELSPIESSLLQTLADQAAVTFENYRLHTLLAQHSAELEVLVEERTVQLGHSESRLRLLLETNNAIVGNLDREMLFDTVAGSLRSVVAFDRASIALFDSEREVLTVVALAGPSPAELHFPVGTETPLAKSRLRVVVDQRRPLVCSNLETEQRTPDEERLLEEGILSYMSVPLVAKDRVIGALNVGSRAVRDWDEDVGLVAEIANQVALAIENMLAYEEIGRLKARLEQENLFLKEEIDTQRSDEIVGESPAMRQLVEQIDLVARTDSTVLVLGESGTGKELVAREIHKRSPRRQAPMIKVNCASVPRELYESEFFGHTRGSFTGATKDRSGRFELADGGTLFLDEVGEIPLELQSKLLRVLQEGQFERVGDERTRTVDVRIVAATNRDLRREVEEGRFREDLYYRINVFPIEVVPLRERKGDIPLLAARFLEMACKRMNRSPTRLAAEDVERLQAHDWPGNVRELQNEIERALILTRLDQPGAPVFDLAARKPESLAALPSRPGVRTYAELKELEREVVSAALAAARGKVNGAGGAAAILGIRPSTLFSRMKAMGIERVN